MKKRKDLDHFPIDLNLKRVENLKGRRIFLEKKGFGFREKREVSRCLSLNKTGLTFEYI